MPGNIWVLAEQWRGQLSEISYEVLALGRELADGLGVSLEALLLGYEAKELAQGLGAADRVLYLDDPALAHPMAETCGQALVPLVQDRQPHSLLIPLTNVVWDCVGLLPAQLQVPFVNFCRDVRVVDGQLEAHCLLYGGKMEVTAAPVGAPTILGILPGTRPADKGRVEKIPAIEQVAVSFPEPPRGWFKRYIEPEAGAVDITQQEVLVAVGRGIQAQENLPVAEELAAALGGAVCGSRPVIDVGWLGLSRQVGKSGMTVKPKLYLAAGISGAPEHVEGMKNSDLIIAINTDPQAPIFNVAHYGIVADSVELLTALTEAVRTKKG